MRIKNIMTQDVFWDKYKRLIKDKVIPYQWKALNDQLEIGEKSHAINNFKIAAGLAKGEYYGEVFQDSDVAKWLETVAYVLKDFPDKDLEEKADEVINIISLAQDDEGYFNTYYLLKEPENKWKNLRDNHELYCGGHFIEAAVAYYKVTGKNQLLNVVCKFVDLVDKIFGNDEQKVKGYPGHQEIELALLRLYDVTNNPKHLNLAKYFLYQRGKEPDYFEFEKKNRDPNEKLIWNDEKNLNFGLGKEYQQNHKPIIEQDEAVGHAVRAVYMYAAMAKLAQNMDRELLFDVTDNLWDDVTNKKMYITGGIGSNAIGESFSSQFDLPNDSMYCETCASVAMTFWGNNMNKIEKKSKYHNIVEKELYNGTISGMNLEGNRFFYVNPLEVNEFQQKRIGLKHVLPERQPWFKTACCPPNLARMIANIEKYIVDIQKDEVYINQYIGSKIFLIDELEEHRLTMKSEFPWKENVEIVYESTTKKCLKTYFRVPEWTDKISINVNGKKTKYSIGSNGYINIVLHPGDIVTFKFNMPVLEVRSNPIIRDNVGKVAIQSGPIIYCLEEIDNGKNLSSIIIKDSSYERKFDKDLLNGVNTIQINGKRIKWGDENVSYYLEQNKLEYQDVLIKAVPYFSWGNRERGEMTVWINKIDKEV